MYVIAGLGNPGKQYEQTHHNMGFITIDYLAEKLGISVNKIKFKALTAETVYNGQKIVLLKPQTYMNLSGESIREIVQFYKLPPEHLIVIYDDIDLDTGKIRIRAKGSAGTHNGMRNIVFQLQTDEFPRIRIGIRGGMSEKMQLRDFVTGGFTKEEVPLLEDAVSRAADAVLCYVSEGINTCMNKYNVRDKKPKEPKEEKDEQATD
ncbi:MAG: aminoacyl-tRNA hydrolase [Firmicutes bacterium]|nr:aminoacyl-tRNA hydrolase [Bacillota bacterium]